MASVLDPHGELGPRLRGAVIGWLDEAIAALAHGATVRGTHEARKACKRVRAALDLVGGSAARASSRQVADAARQLAPVRDFDVMQALVASKGWEIPLPTLPDRGDVGLSAALALHDARTAAAALNYEGGHDHAERFLDSWRSARRRMKSACAPGADADAFHSWRKRVKRTHAQCLLLCDLYPALAPLARELDTLQEVLGDLHDLSVLRDLSPANNFDLDDEINVHERRAVAVGRVALALRPRELARALDAG